MGKLFDIIKEGLEEAVAYEQGKIDLRTKEVSIPAPPKKYDAKDVRKLRKRLHFSQAVLAAFLNVSVKTVQAWESGLRHPTSAALRLLEIMESESKGKSIFSSFRTHSNFV